ncbi:hypothetical protein FOZ60_008551 [Perkinsus olseni]|uniref:Uncharacterized protein n=1 Tax=Perkinsus olseni TaxID=32597 RepID=A0A7J6NJK1_PEROL|nr:hypothetical protein FOZ60_008551 [Perkinsus olseni]
MAAASLSALVMPLCTSDWDMVVAVLTGCLNSNTKIITTSAQLDLLLSCVTSIHLIPQPWTRRQVLVLTTCILVRSGLMGVPAVLGEYLLRSWDDCDLGATLTFDDARFLICLAHSSKGRNDEPLMCRILRSLRVAATFLSSTHVQSTLEMLLDIMLRTGWSHGSFRRPCGMCALLRCFDSGAPTEVDVVDTCLQLIQACRRSGRLDRMEGCLRGRLMEHEAAEIPMMCFIGALRKPQDCKWLQGRLSSHPYPPCGQRGDSFSIQLLSSSGCRSVWMTSCTAQPRGASLWTSATCTFTYRDTPLKSPRLSGGHFWRPLVRKQRLAERFM